MQSVFGGINEPVVSRPAARVGAFVSQPVVTHNEGVSLPGGHEDASQRIRVGLIADAFSGDEIGAERH